jgi:uncharacterized protein
MKPLFFGKSDHQLYGVYHPPSIQKGGRPSCSDSVLLCYPGVQEYNANHWAFRRIAAGLSQLGCHVLRFDYFGTGDSMGQLHDGGLSIWIDDVRQAARELVDMSGNSRLTMVGMRLGATLAYRACAGDTLARNLVMWEPVVSGKSYIRQLERRDYYKNLLFLHSRLLRSRTHSGTKELFGYGWPNDVNAEIVAMDLLAAEPPTLQRMSIVTSWPHPDFQTLCDAAAARGVQTEIRTVGVPGDVTLDKLAMREANVLSNDILSAITLALTETRPGTI